MRLAVFISILVVIVLCRRNFKTAGDEFCLNLLTKENETVDFFQNRKTHCDEIVRSIHTRRSSVLPKLEERWLQPAHFFHIGDAALPAVPQWYHRHAEDPPIISKEIAECLPRGAVVIVEARALQYFFRVIHNFIANPYVLVSYDSDWSAPDQKEFVDRDLDLIFQRDHPHYENATKNVSYGVGLDLTECIESPKILHFYASNCNIKLKKLTCVPVGVASRSDHPAKTMLLDEILRTAGGGTCEGLVRYRDVIPPNLLVSFSRNDDSAPGYKLRNSLWDVLCHKNFSSKKRGASCLPTATAVENHCDTISEDEKSWEQCQIDYHEQKLHRQILATENFLLTLVDHRFVAAPPGMGLDTFRVWESLALGVIPIVPHSVASVSGLYDYLPVIGVGDFGGYLNWFENDMENYFLSIFNARVFEFTCDHFYAAWERLRLRYWIRLLHLYNNTTNSNTNNTDCSGC